MGTGTFVEVIVVVVVVFLEIQNRGRVVLILDFLFVSHLLDIKSKKGREGQNKKPRIFLF